MYFLARKDERSEAGVGSSHHDVDFSVNGETEFLWWYFLEFSYGYVCTICVRFAPKIL